MGLTSTYVLTRTSGVWHGVEDRSLDDINEVAGFTLAARVEDSDWCLVLGRYPDGREWGWVFGEGAGSGAPLAQPRLPAFDQDELHETVDARALETAKSVLEWADSWELPKRTIIEIAEVLRDSDVFAETGWRRFLDLFGLDEPAAEPSTDAPMDAAPARYRARPASPPRAIPIDHDSPGWNYVRDGEGVKSFGEPPCLLEWDGSLYLGVVPPVYLISGGDDPADWGGVGEWVQVPDSASETLDDAVTWANANVGTERKPPAVDRTPLLFEVIDVERDARLPTEARHGEWGLHEKAPPVTAWLLATWDEVSPEKVGDVLADVHRSVISPVVAAQRALGRNVQHGERDDADPWALQIAGSVRSAKGRFGVTTASPTAWPRVVGRMRRGELRAVSVAARRMTGRGLNFPPGAVAEVQFDLELDHEDVPTWEAEDIRFVRQPDAPRLTVSIEAEFAASVPVKALVALLDRLTAALPIRTAFLDVHRFPARSPISWISARQEAAPWLLLQRPGDAYDQAEYPNSEVHNGLVRLKTTAKEPEFLPRVN